MRVGIHTSIAGALENAAHRAHKIGCDTFQIFSANPRGWHTKDPSPEDCERFRQARARYGLRPLAIHANYLINLASGDPIIRSRSIHAFRRELERAAALGADYVVIHPGSAKNGDRSKSAGTFVSSLVEAARGLDLGGVMVLVENTAGQGNVLGSNFEELAAIVQGLRSAIAAGVCVDTAHLLAAGYPIHTAEGLNATLHQLDATVGLENVRLVHANDSKVVVGSRVDRHQHIGKGYIGADGFREILRHPKLRGIPFICETPIDRPGDDRRNLRMMRKLAAEGQNARLCGGRLQQKLSKTKPRSRLESARVHENGTKQSQLQAH
jgi:deoxyribonuclease IV